jgi:hypothetical protein
MIFQTLYSLFLLLSLLSFLLGLTEAGRAAPRMDPGDKTAKTDKTSRGELDTEAWLKKSITYGAWSPRRGSGGSRRNRTDKTDKTHSMASPGVWRPQFREESL